MATTPTPEYIGRRFQGGYIVRILDADSCDPVVCVDCVRCARTMCEASPDTIERDPLRLLNDLMAHERLHGNTVAGVEVVR